MKSDSNSNTCKF